MKLRYNNYNSYATAIPTPIVSTQYVVAFVIALFVISGTNHHHSSSSSSSSTLFSTVYAQQANNDGTGSLSDPPSLISTVEPSVVDSDPVSMVDDDDDDDDDEEDDKDTSNNITSTNSSSTTGGVSDALLRAKFQKAPDGKVIVGDYLIAFNKTRVAEVKEQSKQYLDDEGINVTKAYEALRYAKLRLYENLGNGTTRNERYISLLKQFLESDLVLFVEEDQRLNVTQDTTTTTSPPTNSNTTTDTPDSFTLNQEFPDWGLDRIDQSDLPLNNQYHTDSSGEGVTAFILDTGVLETHVDFEGRASCPFSAISGEPCTDGNGHGTHVAGTIGSKTYGVAKKVKLVGVKVLSNDGSGSNSAVMDGINYILTQKQNNPDGLYVVNLSLGGGASKSLDSSIQDMISAGIFVTVAAGNENSDACSTSPARVKAAVTVGSTDRQDRRSSFSNWGECVQMFAPGSNIKSTWYTSTTATNTISGTSMATPHVAGVAALYLSTNGYIPPSTLNEQIITDGVDGVVTDTQGTPNILLNMESLFQTIPATPPSSKATSTFTKYNSIVLLFWSAGTTACLLLLINTVLL